jgi:diguanylate cyclase (GGDEF)-like protein/PAS domain S-box-containing protein
VPSGRPRLDPTVSAPDVVAPSGDPALALAALRAYAIVGTPPDGAFDDLLGVAMAVAGTQAAACTFHEADRHWCKARVGDVPETWGPEGPGRPVAATVPICAAGGLEIGAIVLFGERPLDPARRPTIETLADLVITLLEERRPGGTGGAPRWSVAIVGPEGTLCATSPRLAARMGWKPADVIGRQVFDFVHPDDHAVAVESLARTATYPGEKYPLDVRFLRSDGTPVLLEVTAQERADPATDQIVFVVREASARTSSDSFVSDQAPILGLIARGAPMAHTLGAIAALVARHVDTGACIMLADEHEPILRCVASAGVPVELLATLDGVKIAPDSITCGVVVLRNQASRCADIAADQAWAGQAGAAAAAGIVGCWSTPIRSSVTADAIGTLALYRADSAPPRAEDVRLADLCAGLAGVAIQRAVAEEQLAYRAMHDPLTGLANRALFLDRLSHALSLRRDRVRYTAVMFLDLDRFKVINDALGHETGDELLSAVAKRLTAVSRSSETVARFGGDEFTVLCEDLRSPRDAGVIARRFVEALRAPLPLGAGDVTMSVSIGVAVTDNPDDEPGTLLRDADAAMYRAKHRGRNRVEVFDERMRAGAVARLDLEHALEQSVQRGDFALLFQPEVDLPSGEVIGAEALLRWHHPERGVLAPGDFIPIAEETGAITALGEWVLAEVCERARWWTAAMPASQAFTLWANISVVQLLRREFPSRVRDILAATRASPFRLGLEITESALMTDADAARVSLAELRALGISIAIDDFGTGYSSLAYLQRLPVDIVKIDRSFIDSIDRNARGASVVAAIVQLAHAVGCQVVAEGVETRRQFDTLVDVGCDMAQGHYIGRPEAVTRDRPAWVVERP